MDEQLLDKVFEGMKTKEDLREIIMTVHYNGVQVGYKLGCEETFQILMGDASQKPKGIYDSEIR